MTKRIRQRCKYCNERTTHVEGDCIVCAVAQRTAERRLTEQD